MDATTKRLVALLDHSDLQLRTAAIRVVTEMGLGSKGVIQALAKCLREPYEELQITALKALARLGAQDVAPTVVPLLLASGGLREQAMAVVAAIGPTVVPRLDALYVQGDFHGKRAVITTLARIGGKSAVAVLLKVLPREPFELQKHLTFNICEALDRMTPAQQTPVLPLATKLARSSAKNPQVLVAALIILGHFKGQVLAAKARKALREYVEKKHPPEVRRYALVSLNRLVHEAKTTPDYMRFLMRVLCDEDWQNIAQHALRGLERIKLPTSALSSLVDLLKKSPHFSVHIHVFERLRGADRPEVARAIIPFLADSRFRVREAAETALRQMPSAIECLFDVLMHSDDLEVTQRVNSILRDFPPATRTKYVDPAAAKLMRLFERNDPHYLAFLDFIRAVDPEPLRARIYKKARALKKGRSRERWEKIRAYLQLLWDHHLITPEGRYLFSIALLRQGQRDLAPAARRADLGLRVIRALIYDDCPALVKKLKSDADVKAEDYFYLGFHFSEESEEVRQFGVAMLEHVAEHFPKSKVAGPAMHKLQLGLRAERQETPAAGEKRRMALRQGGSQAAARKKPAKSARVIATKPAASSAGRASAAPAVKPSSGSAGKKSAASTAPKKSKKNNKKKKTSKKSPAASKRRPKKAAKKKAPSRKR